MTVYIIIGIFAYFVIGFLSASILSTIDYCHDNEYNLEFLKNVWDEERFIFVGLGFLGIVTLVVLIFIFITGFLSYYRIDANWWEGWWDSWFFPFRITYKSKKRKFLEKLES